MKIIRQLSTLFCFLSVMTQLPLAEASDTGSAAAVVPEGEYALFNHWEKGRQRLTALQQALDPDSQQRIQPLMKPGGQYLDVGAGLGSMSRYMADQAGDHGHVLALDIDNTFLDEIGATGPRVDTLQADITAYQPEPDKYDFIYARLVFLHLAGADRQMLINKLANALKSGGYLFIDGFVEGDNRNRFLEFARIDPRLPEYAREFYRQAAGHVDFNAGYRYGDMLSVAGLVNIQSEVSMKRVQGGSDSARFTSLSWEQFQPYMLSVPDHDILYPMIMSALGNPDLHWYSARIYVSGQKS